MNDLQAVFVGLGYSTVVTYIRSGNVIFETASDEAKAIAAEIEHAIAGEIGLDVRVLLRSRKEMAQVVEGNPFLAGGLDRAKLHVTFLEAVPDPALLTGINAGKAPPDEFHASGSQVYLYCPEGYGRSKLNNAFWERRLRVAATTRNWNTVETLLQLTSTP